MMKGKQKTTQATSMGSILQVMLLGELQGIIAAIIEKQIINEIINY